MIFVKIIELGVGAGGLGQKMENSLHMLAISSEIRLQYSNKSTQVNYNVKAKESSKMSKNDSHTLQSHI